MVCGLFRDHLICQGSDVKVDSAGTRAVVGQPATMEAQEVMFEIGIDISGHRAKQLTFELASSANLILTMESFHKADIINNFPSAKGRTFLLGEWGDFEIPDPYMQPPGFFVTIRDLIEEGWNDWKARI